MENNNINNERDDRVDVFKMLDEFMAKKEQEELESIYNEEPDLELQSIIEHIVMRDMQIRQARARRRQKIKDILLYVAFIMMLLTTVGVTALALVLRVNGLI